MDAQWQLKRVLFIEDAVDDGAARFVEYFHRHNVTDYTLEVAPTIMEAVRLIERRRYDMIILDNHVALGAEPDQDLEPELHRYYTGISSWQERKRKTDQQQLKEEMDRYRQNNDSDTYTVLLKLLNQPMNAPILGYEFLFTLYGAVKKTYAMIPLKKYPDWLKSLFENKQVGIFTIDNDSTVEQFLEMCNLPKDNHYKWKANAEDSVLLQLIKRIAANKPQDPSHHAHQ